MNRELLQANLAELENERLNAERRQSQLMEFGNNLALWHAKQSNTLFGSLSTHLDEQIAQTDRDLAATKSEINVEIPDEAVRIDLRKAFHRRLMRTLSFDIRLILFVMLFPKAVEFLDNLQFATLLGVGIYPTVGASLFFSALMFVLLMRLRRGKVRWPGKRIAKWLVWAGIISIIISLWYFISPLAHIWMMSPFFPSIWQVLLFSLGWFIVVFLGAILTYHAGFRKHWNDIAFARATLEWASRGSLHIRGAKFLLTQNRKQVHYFATLFGVHLRKPWIVPETNFSDDRWVKLAAKFPPAIKVALAVEEGDGVNARPRVLNQIIDRIYETASARGWRKSNFDRVLESASRDMTVSLDFSTALDQDSPATPNGSRAKLLELVQNDTFMGKVGATKHSLMMREVQKSLLETEEILVRRVKPQLGQPDVLKWDEHLASVIGNPSMGSPSLAQFAIHELSRDGHNDGVRTVIYGPKKLIGKLTSDGQSAASTVELRAVNPAAQTGVDLVLRLDIAGIDKAIPASVLRLPVSLGVSGDVQDDSRCPRCGRLDCSQFAAGIECTWSGI